MNTSMVMLVIVIIGLKFYPSDAQGTCDPLANQCINGMCQMQMDMQYGCTCNQNYMIDPVNPLVCSPMGTSVMPAGTCDPLANQCINGMCQMQSNMQYGCTCNQHYMKDPTNPLVCHPIPPCNLISGTQQCVNGMCQMLPSGQYSCLCNPGYQISLTDPNYCENMNECLLPMTGCSLNGCTDLVGDYVCTSCAPGFVSNQFSKCEVARQNVPNQVGSDGGSPLMWAMMMGDFF